MNNKEVGHKKHVLRRIFFAASIISAVAFAGAVIATSFLSTPAILLSSIGIGVGCVSGAIALSAFGNLAYSKVAEKRSKKASLNSIKQISEIDKDASSSMSKNKRIKIAKKFAKANLKLCKLVGCPFCGRYRSNSTLTEKENEKFNKEQNEALLVDIKNVERHEKGVFKDKKFKSKQKLSSESVRNRLQVWTKEYNNFLSDVAIKDKRIEIGWLCKSTTNDFANLVDDMPATEEIGGTAVVSLEGTNPIKQTYARVSDERYLNGAREILLKDVYNACKDSPIEKVNTFFPFTIQERSLDEKTRITVKDTQRIRSFSELLTALGYVNTNNLNKNIDNDNMSVKG